MSDKIIFPLKSYLVQNVCNSQNMCRTKCILNHFTKFNFTKKKNGTSCDSKKDWYLKLNVQGIYNFPSEVSGKWHLHSTGASGTT